MTTGEQQIEDTAAENAATPVEPVEVTTSSDTEAAPESANASDAGTDAKATAATEANSNIDLGLNVTSSTVFVCPYSCV